MIAIDIIIEKLKNIGFKLTGDIDKLIFYFENDNCVIMSVTKPEDLESWMIRLDYREIFDRWGNCFYENYVDNIEELDSCIQDIIYFSENKDKEIEEYLNDDYY